jgi:hypothetical protein
MTPFSKAVTTAVAAALLATTPAFAAVAGAAPAHAKATHATAAKAKPKHVVDRLAGPRKGAANAVKAQLKAVDRLVTAASAATIADGAALSAALVADQSAVQADLSAVSTATSVKALRTLVAAAGKSRQIARTQYEVVLAADTAAVQAGTLDATVTDLGAKLADPALPTDPAAGLALLADATAQLATVTSTVPSIVSGILAVAPNATRAQLHAANVAAQAGLLIVTTALQAVATDVADVQVAYGF